MNAKVCLLLALGLLFGALATGNPFLRVPMRASAAPPPSAPTSQPVLDLDLMAAPRGRAVPAAFQSEGFACPDPALEGLVLRVTRLADGSPCWVLRDGRQFRQDPASPARLIAVAAEVAGPERDSDEAPR